MEERIIFRRIKFFPIFMSVCAAFMIISGLIVVSVGGPMGLLFIILGIVQLINASWMFRTPFIVIENEELTVYFSMLVKKSAQMGEIRSFERHSKNKFSLYLNNGLEIKIHLSYMMQEDKDKFEETLKSFIP